MRVFGSVASMSILIAIASWGQLAACGDDPAQPPSDTSDAVGDAGDADTVASNNVTLTLHLIDFLTKADLEGLSASVLDQSGTTDAGGTVTLSVPRDTDLTITVTGAGTRDHLFYHRTGADDEALTYPLGTDGTITAFEAILGLTVAETKGILEIVTFDASTGAPIPNLTITADAASDLTLVFDAASGTGLSAGATTVEGSPSTAILVNIDAGAVTPSFTHLWGWTCSGPPALDVPAGSYVIAEYGCSFTPVVQSVKLTDFLSGAGIEGATVSVLGQTLTSDAEGLVSFDAPPNADVAITVTGTGFRDHVIYRRTADHEAVETYPLGTDTTISTLEGVLQLTVDDTLGILELLPREAGSRAFIPGLTVDLDVAYDLGLVFDAESATGLSAGTTTLAGSPSTVIFVNATAGDVSPTFSDAAGNVCAVGPLPVPLAAGTYVIAEYECAVPSN